MRRILALIVLLGVLAVSAPASGSQVAELEAGEGSWAGTVSFVGSSGGVTAAFSGGFDMVVFADGSVEGTFGWSRAGASPIISGVIVGTASDIVFEITSVISNGVAIPDASGSGEVELTFVLCERIEGTAGRLDTSAVVTNIVWWAVRDAAASASPGFLDATQELRVELNELIRTFEATGAIAFDELEVLLDEAEMLAAALPRTPQCGGDAFYRSIIAPELTQLLLAVALADPSVVDAATFERVVYAAARAGLIGFNPSVPSAAGLTSATLFGLDDRIEAAADSGDAESLEVYLTLAVMFGWTDQEAAAREALAEVGS